MSQIWMQAVRSLTQKHQTASEERRQVVAGITGAIALASAGFPRQVSAKAAEPFALPRLVSRANDSSALVSLASFKGKWIYLDFWASWCTPCRLSFPWMQQMHARYQPKGLEIVAICLDRDADKGRHFLAREASEFTVLWDQQADTAKRYGVAAMPSSYLIDPKGLLLSGHAGFTPAIARKLEAEFEKLLG